MRVSILDCLSSFCCHGNVNNSSSEYTGAITTLAPLDHETTQLHELVVKVNDDGTRIYSDYAKVIIHVVDHNDHPPEFVTGQLDVRIHEMSIIGSTVTRVQATDRDKGDNARIQYSLLSGMTFSRFDVYSTVKLQ